jgi:guanylate kinase
LSAQPLLIVVSGPSGSGKGTLCNMLRAALPQIYYSISMTTRPARNGETDGVEYYFVSSDEFLERLKAEEFLEWAQVYDHYYGSLRQPVEEALQSGRDVLMELDIQGAQQVKKAFPQAVLIFIVPPSLEELDSRINRRGKDSAETIRKRMNSAPAELKAAQLYNYTVVNDEMRCVLDDFLGIIKREKANLSR